MPSVPKSLRFIAPPCALPPSIPGVEHNCSRLGLRNRRPPLRNACRSGAIKKAGPGMPTPVARRAPAAGSAALQLRNEEDFAARPQDLEIGRLVVDRAVDRDRRFLFQVLAEAGKAAIELLQHVAHCFGFDVEFALAAGVAPAE